jgi:biofilm PGA synthesis lipoprotein PgaB
MPSPEETMLINPQVPLTVRRTLQNRVPMTLIEGGVAGTRRSAQRCDVRTFVTNSGAEAGLNGTFFSDASLRGRDSNLIGPTICGGEMTLTPGACDRSPILVGRPMVLLSPIRTCVVAYQPAAMQTDADLRNLLPGLTDAFLGGVWLVHKGVAATPAQLAQAHIHDAEDFRRRAFFVLESDGRPGLGATTSVTSSQQLAKALQETGVQEAVLLDSGFSTSLVYGKKIFVTGHTSPGLPSRPVPHALVLYAARPRASAPPKATSRTAA